MRTLAPIAFLTVLLATLSSVALAQPRIARIQPDAIAPGMTIALEILSFETDQGAFGTDGIAPNDVRIVLNNPQDSNRIVFGPTVVSWNGRLIQVPVIVPLSAAIGFVDLHVERGVEKSETVRLQILQPGPAISIFGNGLLGDEATGGSLTEGNTLIVESLELSSSNPINDVFRFVVTDLNGTPVSKRLHPVTILSRGPIRIRNTTLSVSADSINGGPGGGGGGAGFVGTGGYGYTGGGSSDTVFNETNAGSGAGPNASSGGPSRTGVRGGKSDESDQGGGGGTGNPFGSSGLNGGQNSPSFDGGYGGASAGGEQTSGPYGGGGGGFATGGAPGVGVGDNAGKANGGRFLVPMMGGSGGGAGNSTFASDSLLKAGDGGGGGGAMTIVSYQLLDIANGARIFANGANGKAGLQDREGGGGGGSGGAVVLASRAGINTQNAIFSASNGIGGNGGGSFDSSARGGNGGLGHIRFDGLQTEPCASCTGATTYGPTLTVPSVPVTTKGIRLSGFAGIGNDLSDSIRIYYRTRHTSWNRVDTIRKRSGAVFIWEKSILTPPDSLLFVCVYAKVNDPRQSFANYEPDWLMGHLSSGIIPIDPSSNLVVSPDTLNVGCTKRGTCLDGLVYIENRGEALLRIDTVYTEADAQFKVVNYPRSLTGYDPKNVTIRYCPQEVQSDTAQLVIVADGGVVYRKTILIGCGLDKDRRIAIAPDAVIDFGRVHVGDSCAERNITISSEGDDPVTVDLGNLIRPPFEIVDPTTSVIELGRRPDAKNVRIRFCPKDTGSFRETFIVTERRDSFVLHGIGTRRILFAPDTFWLGEHCVKSGCVDTSFLLYSVGNEKITDLLPAVDTRVVTLIHPSNKQDLPPGGNEKIEFKICFDSVGEQFTPISYISDADTNVSTVRTILHYRGLGLILSKIDNFDLGAICTGSCDSVIASIKNLSSPFRVTSATFHDSVFTLTIPQLPDTVGENDSLVVQLKACPPASGEFFDTLVVHIEQGECDSTLLIPIRVVSSDAALVLSGNTIAFDPVDSGSCVQDTVFLENPCKADILVRLPSRTGVFERLEPVASEVTIPGEDKIALIYEFCPLDSNFHSEEDTIVYNGSFARLVLSGKGRIKTDAPQPYIRLAFDDLTDATVAQKFDYKIRIDSIFGENAINAVKVDLVFDPIVVLPIGIISDAAGWSVTGSEMQPGLFHFTATRSASVSTGPFATIRMQALRSRRDRTSVTIMNASIEPQGIVTGDTGTIQTNACATPPTNIVIPGEYALGDPTPNPLRAIIQVPIKLGAEGMLDLRLYNAQGVIVLSKSAYRTKGDHQLAVDVTAIPPGYYILEARSWGWRDRKNVVIVK